MTTVTRPGPYVFVFEHDDRQAYRFGWRTNPRAEPHWDCFVYNESHDQWNPIELDEVWEKAVIKHFKLETVRNEFPSAEMSGYSPREFMDWRQEAEKREGLKPHDPYGHPDYPGAGSRASTVS